MMGRKAMLMAGNTVLGAVLGLVALKLIALYFRADASGQVYFAMGILGFGYFITDMGMGQAHIKRVSEGRDPGDCFATFAVFKVVATAVFVIGVLGFLYVWTTVLGKPVQSTTIPVVLVILLYYVGKSLQEIGQSSFDARLETARSQASLFTDTIVRVGLTAVGAFVVGAIVWKSGPFLGLLPQAGPFAAWVMANRGTVMALAVAAGGLAAATTSLYLLWRVHERGRFRWDLLRDYATFAFPLFLTSAIGIIAANVDAAALGFFLSEFETGVFGNVRRLPIVLAGVGTAIGVLLFPAVSGMAARGEDQAIHRMMDHSVRYLSMLLAPMVAFLIVFAQPIILIVMHREFLAGATAMGVLGGYAYVTTLAIPHSNLLLGFGHSRTVATLGGITAISIIVFDLLLIPTDIRSLGIELAGLGVNGAALGTLLSGLVWYGLLRWKSYQTVGYIERGHVWKHLVAAGAMVGLLVLFHEHALALVRLYHVPIYVVLGAALYLAALLLLREFTRDDWAYLRESIHPIEMLRYLRGELTHRRP